MLLAKMKRHLIRKPYKGTLSETVSEIVLAKTFHASYHKSLVYTEVSLCRVNGFVYCETLAADDKMYQGCGRRGEGFGGSPLLGGRPTIWGLDGQSTVRLHSQGLSFEFQWGHTQRDNSPDCVLPYMV